MEFVPCKAQAEEAWILLQNLSQMVNKTKQLQYAKWLKAGLSSQGLWRRMLSSKGATSEVE